MFNYRDAFAYYDRFINQEERFDLLRTHQFPVAGSVPSIDWELFGSILTGEQGKQGYGSDLASYEIKSAVGTGSFEYQYHLLGGPKKLKEDMVVDHIFISYSADYAGVIVRLVRGVDLALIFQKWEPDLIANYSVIPPKQRFRRSVAYGTVARLGEVIMRIESGLLVFPALPPG